MTSVLRHKQGIVQKKVPNEIISKLGNTEVFRYWKSQMDIA